MTTWLHQKLRTCIAIGLKLLPNLPNLQQTASIAWHHPHTSLRNTMQLLLTVDVLNSLHLDLRGTIKSQPGTTDVNRVLVAIITATISHHGIPFRDPDAGKRRGISAVVT
jgi:hypothetical protein